MRNQDNNQFSTNMIDDSNVDVKRYISLFISNWYWFAIALFFAFTIAYGINRYSEKIYTVSATLLIEDDQIGGGLTNAESFIPGGELFKSQQNLRNEIGILQSFTLNKRVVDSLSGFNIIYVAIGRRNIVETLQYKDCPIIVQQDGTSAQPGQKVNIKIKNEQEYDYEINDGSDIKGTLKFGERFTAGGFNLFINLRDPKNFIFDDHLSNKYLFWFSSQEYLANYYRGKLSIEPIDKEASMVRLTLSGPVARKETDYLNKLMDLYIMQGMELKWQTADSTMKFIDRQIGEIFDTLTRNENDLLRFRNTNNLLDISSEGSLIQARLERFGTEKTTLELQKKYYDYLDNYLKKKQQTADVISPAVMGVTDLQLTHLVQELAGLQKDKRQLSMNLNSNTKPVEVIDENIRKVMNSLREVVDGGIITLNASLEDVEKRLKGVLTEMEKLPSKEKELLRIQRKFDVNNTVYTFLLEKMAEAGIAKASTVSENRIVDRAAAFNSIQVKPQIRNNYLLALVFGFFIPVIGIFLIDYLNNKIIDRKDVEKGTDAPVLGYISHNSYRSEIPVTEKPGSTLAESFRSVRTNLKYFTKEIKNPVIAVSSTISSEGKTFVSVNLASIIASLGKKVLLVGLDLRKPRIHKILEINNNIGVTTWLTGDNEFKDIIYETKIENLYFSPAGPIPPNPAELIETLKMKTFFEKAREEFDYVIIDTTPIAIVTDALLIAPHIDMYLLVVRQRYTSRNTLELIQELYKGGSMKSLGLVINDISLTGYYGYGLRYGYNMGYGYSYGYNYYSQKGYGRYGYSGGATGYYTED